MTSAPILDVRNLAVSFMQGGRETKAVRVPIGEPHLEGDLCVPSGARALVVFAHGSGSSRLSSRNRFVAGILQAAGLGTLLFDLLTARKAA